MKKPFLKHAVLGLVLAGSTLSAWAEEPKVLRVYNWSDYIGENTIADFEKATGIKVTYDVYDGNDILEAKLLAGGTGFDIVVPSLNFMGRQIKAGVFQTVDKSKLSNYGNLNPEIMARVAMLDPDNAHGVPYLWGTTGFGYNVDKVKAALGEDAPVDSWDLLLKPENLAKLKSCGVSFLDAPDEIIPIVLNYLGKDPNAHKEEDIRGPARDLLMSLRDHVTYFHSSQYINDLANGDICVAIGWSGDMFIAKDRAEEAGNGVNIAYTIPKEGAQMFFDMMAIPKDAPHPENAHKFIDFVLKPEQHAGVTNYVYTANPNVPAKEFVEEEIRTNPSIYPSEETQKKLFVMKVAPAKIDRAYTRVWTEVKTGR